MFGMNNNMMGNMNLNMNMNINPMGMNNQLMPNLAMDDSAMRIKIIIEPYEKKITELESIIKQKDFEIVLLKDKLNAFTNNQMMMNFQNNMNIMNPMMMNNDGNLINDFNFNMVNNNNNMNLNLLNNNGILLKDWIINFNYKNKNYPEECNSRETIKTVSERFCNKIGIKYNGHKFIFNGNYLLKKLTLVECGLVNDSTILVIEKERVKCENDTFCYFTDKECEDGCTCEGFKYSVNFKDTTGETRAVICLGKEHSIGALIKRYLEKAREKEFAVLYNNCNLCSLKYLLNWLINGKKKIKDIFKNNINPIVIIDYFRVLNGH